jgi:membrane protein YdbS with pleckstrin-like domain
VTEPRRSSRPDPEGTTSEQTPPQGEPQQDPADPEAVLDMFGRPYYRAGPFPIEKSGDPLGGHPIDEPMRFWWSRRRRPIDDGIPTAPIDDPAPVSRSLLRERVSRSRTRHFPLPDEAVHNYLGSGEQVLHIDHPSFRYFVVSNFLFFLALVAAGVGAVYCLGEGWTLAAQILLGVMIAIVLYLFFLRLGDRYTSYVITNARMIRMSGVVSRKIESIPWVRVTDVQFRQSAFERMLGYATLDIESANENMGLRHMQGIADPVTFNHHLMDMVVAKQGPAAPLGRQSEYQIMQSDKGLFGRRRRRQAEEQRRRLILDDAHPEAGTEAQQAADATEQYVGPTAATPGTGGPGLGPTIDSEGDNSDI